MAKIVFLHLYIMMFCLFGGVTALITKEIYADMAIEVFQTKRITNVIMFLCWKTWNIKDRVDITRRFSAKGITVAQPVPTQDNAQRVKDIFRTENFQMGIIFDVTCYVEMNPSYQKNTYFDGSYFWLSFDFGYFDFIVNHTSTLPLTIASDGLITKTTISEDNSSYSIQLFDIYNPGFDRGSKVIITYIGDWIKGDSAANKIWQDFIMLPKVIRRHDLKGIVIKAVTVADHKPENTTLEEYMADEHHPNFDSVFRMNFRLIKLLKFMYNFKISLVMADNWSDKNSQGFYRSGNLLGILGDKKADIMAGALQLMSDRMALVDTIHMTYPFRSGFVFRYSGDFGEVKATFLRPFDSNVWIIMVSVSLVIIATLWFILIFENKFFTQDDEMHFSFSEAMLSILTAWCQMGSGVRPSTYASRLVYITLFFNSLILYNYYTSSIVSSLLSYRSQKFSLVDLANSPMKCGSLDIGYVHNLLFDIPIYPHMKYFNSKKKQDPFYFTIADGVRRVKDGGFAYHSEYSTLYSDISETFQPTEICELQEVDTIPAVALGIMAQKHSPYTEMFRVGLMKARERGQLKRLLQVWVTKKPACQTSKGVSEVNIHQTVSIFLLLIFGQILAVLILFYERHKWKKSQLLMAEEKNNTKY